MNEASSGVKQPWMRPGSTREDLTDDPLGGYEEEVYAEDGMAPGTAAARTRAAINHAMPTPPRYMGPAILQDLDGDSSSSDSAEDGMRSRANGTPFRVIGGNAEVEGAGLGPSAQRQEEAQRAQPTKSAEFRAARAEEEVVEEDVKEEGVKGKESEDETEEVRRESKASGGWSPGGGGVLKSIRRLKEQPRREDAEVTKTVVVIEEPEPLEKRTEEEKREERRSQGGKREEEDREEEEEEIQEEEKDEGRGRGCAVSPIARAAQMLKGRADQVRPYAIPLQACCDIPLQACYPPRNLLCHLPTRYVIPLRACYAH
eukprot:501671-Rhodomonas_salina.2